MNHGDNEVVIQLMSVKLYQKKVIGSIRFISMQVLKNAEN